VAQVAQPLMASAPSSIQVATAAMAARVPVEGVEVVEVLLDPTVTGVTARQRDQVLTRPLVVVEQTAVELVQQVAPMVVRAERAKRASTLAQAAMEVEAATARMGAVAGAAITSTVSRVVPGRKILFGRITPVGRMTV
jgi:hypothetical protein